MIFFLLQSYIFVDVSPQSSQRTPRKFNDYILGSSQNSIFAISVFPRPPCEYGEAGGSVVD
jgi:hypothetical protein